MHGTNPATSHFTVSATYVWLASPTPSESATRKFHTKAFVAGIPRGGLAAILFDYNNGIVVVGVGGPYSSISGHSLRSTAITKTNDTTFTVHADGIYRVSYTLRTALMTLLGSVRVQVNGVGVGPTASLVVVGVPLTDQVTFQASAGDTVQLVVSGVALTLAAGDNAIINIDKIQ